MKRRSRNTKLIAEINIAPFTDVVLVLLIIFMVATPFIFRSSIKIALPQVSQNQQPPQTRDIQVTITAGGDVFLESQKYNLRKDGDLLRFKIQQLAKKSPNASIVINGDRSVKYDVVVSVIDMASKAGIGHLVLATEFKK